MKRPETKKLALASVLCALSVVIAVVGCVFDMADLVACTGASLTVYLSGIELRGKYPYLIYAVTGALLFLFFPTATVTFYFILFFGYYPIIKRFLDKLNKWLSRVIKFIIFNIAIILIFILMSKLLIDGQVESELYLLPVLWLFANIFFAVYDFSLSFFSVAYIRFYRKKWGIDKFMLR